jgi:uncharacterized RDD family membrane protein YckC
MTADMYIDRVLAHLPAAPALRQQIAMDLRSHIAERMERGQSIDEVVRQLGDPTILAESYLGAVPLVAATFWERAQAKLFDGMLVLIVAMMFALFVVFVVLGGREAIFFIPPIAAAGTAIAFPIYTIIAEARTGQTIGKRLLDLRVVRESGAAIGLGQAIVRQLPMFLQIFMIDVLFALFTDKSQRAFEIISKTRVVRVPADESAA